uniref:Calponin-homology (CH) domain-containing protein n=1 Tax=Eptatretus burgeri TaxID=7764 RepID=A0A8C4QV05_EPTBU
MAESKQRPKFVGQGRGNIMDVMQRLQVEQEAVQKRTFTKWMNSHLAKHARPLKIEDLFKDLRDGIPLIALLEVLSGQKLSCEHGRRLSRIHALANIGTALKFLESQRIKLVNINASDIADGKPSIVLGLTWIIILYFQIEELTNNLPAISSFSGSSSSLDSQAGSEASPPIKKRPLGAFASRGNAKKALLKWVQYKCTSRLGLRVQDFGPSWRNGVAFHSVIHSIRPELVNLEQLKVKSNRENLDSAFSIAETYLGIPRLLEPEDVDVDKPDEKSVMTYVAQFLKHYPDVHDAEGKPLAEERQDRAKYLECLSWLDQMNKDIMTAQSSPQSHQEKYQGFRSKRIAQESQRNNVLLMLQPIDASGKMTPEQAAIKQGWEQLSARLLEWQAHLDKALPAPLGALSIWLVQAENTLTGEVPIGRSDEETIKLVQAELETHMEFCYEMDEHQRMLAGASVSSAPSEQLEDMRERLMKVSTSSKQHITKLEYLKYKHQVLALLAVVEIKLRDWSIKYGRKDSVLALLQDYMNFIDGSKFLEQYDTAFDNLKKRTQEYLKMDITGI